MIRCSLVTLLLPACLAGPMACAPDSGEAKLAASLPPELRRALAEGPGGEHALRVAWGMARRGQGPPEALCALMERKIWSRDVDEAVFGVGMLGRLPSRGQWKILADAIIRRGNERVLAEAMVGLGIMADAAAVPFLLERLRKGAKVERLAAADAMDTIRAGGGRCGFDRIGASGVIGFPPGAEPLFRPKPTPAERLADHEAWWKRNGKARLAERRGVALGIE